MIPAPPARTAPAGSSSDGRLPPVVKALGWVSFFTDAASDLIYPLLPAFLKSIGAGGGALGVVEGVAESVGAFVKWYSGRIADRAAKRKPLVVAGYAVATFVRPLLALAAAPWHVVAIRSVDRVGKGIRSAPRDGIVAHAVEPASRAAAFGFHRMMDNAGAVLGPFLAFALARWLHLGLRAIFAAAIVPGLLALGTLVFGVVEPPHTPSPAVRPHASATPPPHASPAPPALRAYLAIVAIFTLGASADSFLLLRIGDLGLDAAYVPLVWLSLNATKALTNLPGGRLADRIGRKRALTIAWVVYGLAYGAFALTHSVALTWVLIVLYGTYYGLAEGAEKALVADLAPSDARGRAFGAFHAITGLVVLPANAVFGALYGAGYAGAAFSLGAIAALVAAAGLALAVKTAP